MFLFIVKIIERLLHRLPKPLPEPSWIQAKEFLVESLNHLLVITSLSGLIELACVYLRCLRFVRLAFP